jgi:hypothetical protein
MGLFWERKEVQEMMKMLVKTPLTGRLITIY